MADRRDSQYSGTGPEPSRIRTSSSGGMVRGNSAIMKEEEEEDVSGSGAASTGSSIGEMIKGFAIQFHGLGEWFRGNVGAALDSMSNSPDGKAKHEEIARRGKYQMRTKKFAPKNEDERR